MEELSRIESQRLGPTNAPTSEDFAMLLGFKGVDGARNEAERLYILRAYRHLCLERKSEAEQDAIWAQFCASYLPMTVDRFLNAPVIVHPDSAIVEDFELTNAYHEMLVTIQHSHYFAKYLRSTDPNAVNGKRLSRVLAQRISTVGPRWNREMAEDPERFGAAACSLELLSTLCASLAKEDQETVVTSQTKQSLMPLLRRWGRQRDHEFLGFVSTRTYAQLSGATDCQADVRRLRRVCKNWDVCGFLNCANTANLKACAKCQTVRYCSADHQRQHWKSLENVDMPHKRLCYPTVY